MSIHIRWMVRRDLSDVLRIERAGNRTPWTEDDFLYALRQRNIIGMVAEDTTTGRIVGHMMYSLHAKHLTVLNLAYGNDRAVGGSMAAKLIGKLDSHRRTRIVFDVYELAVGRQVFLREVGFAAVRCLRDHYGDGLDAIRFEYRLDEPEVNPLVNRISRYIAANDGGGL